MLRMVALSGLVGALVGSLVTAVVAWLVAGRQIDAHNRARQRDDLREIVASFWASTDALWRAKRALGWTVFEIVSTGPGDVERKRELERQRQETFAEIHAAETKAGASLGLLRIIYPDLEPTAQALIEASRKSMSKVEDSALQGRLEADRTDALAAFEEHARKILAPAPLSTKPLSRAMKTRAWIKTRGQRWRLAD